MEIFRLMGSILISNDEANRSIDETDQRAQKTTKTFGEMIGAAVKVGAGIATGLGVAITALGGLLASTSENAKMIDKFSQVTGFSTEGFQKWDYVMKGVGYSMEQASGDMAALAEKAMEAASGAGESADMFKMLGVSVLDSNGQLKSQEQLFNESIKGLQGMEDITKRNAIATALFSTTGEELGPILNMTAEELEATKNKAAELGLVMSKDALEANLKYAQTVADMKAKFGAFWTEIANKVLPTFQAMLDWVIKNMPAIENEISYAMGVAGQAINKVGVAITETKEFFTEHWNVVAPIIAGIGAGAVTVGLMSVAIKVWTIATEAATIAQGALNFVMNLSPFAKVTGLIILLTAAGVALYQNFDTVKAKAGEMWMTVENAFRKGVNGAIDLINSLIEMINKIPGVEAPLIARVELKYTNKSSAKSMDERLGNAGYNAQGTNFWRGGLTWVGEEGPELINAPRGSRIFSNPESMAMAGGGITRGNITVNINDAFVLDNYGVDQLMDRVMDRLALKGVR